MLKKCFFSYKVKNIYKLYDNKSKSCERGKTMSKVTRDTIIETIKELPEEQQEIILYLADIFEGEEETIFEYCKKELIN
jgi:hypothetical protein